MCLRTVKTLYYCGQYMLHLSRQVSFYEVQYLRITEMTWRSNIELLSETNSHETAGMLKPSVILNII